MDQNDKNNEGIDLSGSLKDSSTGVKFDEGWRVEHSYYPDTPKMIQWVIKYSGGLVKDEKQASYVLLGFVVLAVVVSLFLIFGGGNKQQKSFTPGAEAPSQQGIPPAEF